jgi:LmbE family N-acetylglucosaminyl deacetylase
MGTGGILAKYAQEGVETYLVTATRGEHGWPHGVATYPDPEQLGQRREAELNAAAAVLGIQQVHFLDYTDGELDQAKSTNIVADIVRLVRRVQPQVVVTFGPDGGYGHPDHIAISQFTTAAVLCAADPSYTRLQSDGPCRVSKLYYFTLSKERLKVFQETFGELGIDVDGKPRRASGWEPWAITTRIDTETYWRTVWQAVRCHQSQLVNLQSLEEQPAETHKQLWGHQTFYRALSLVNGGRKVETDLFDGLRNDGHVT